MKTMEISAPKNRTDLYSITPDVTTSSLHSESQKQTEKNVIYSRMAILNKVQKGYPPGSSAIDDRITVSLVNNLYELQRVSKTDITPYLPGGRYNLFA